MFFAALYTIIKIWKQPRCSSVDEWLNCEIYIYMYGILFRHKKDEILPFTTTWMDFQSIMLSKISQRKTSTV